MSRLDPSIDMRLWTLIAKAKGKRAAFDKALAGLSDEALLEHAALALNASHAIRAPYEGPFIPSLKACLSEGSTEDFTNWIVDQGEARWRALVGAHDTTLAKVFETAYDRKGVNAVASIYVAAAKRMGDAYYEALERLLDEDAGVE